MDLWYPPDHQPALLEWWQPLLLASAAARRQRCAWPIHLDEFQLMGRVDRPSRPAIWVYKHAESRREVYLDATGQPYAYTRTPNAKGHGRFTQTDVRTAIWRADLPRFVAPVFYDEPSPAPTGWSASVEPPEPGEVHEPSATERDRVPRRRGHLTVIDGGAGRPLAG